MGKHPPSRKDVVRDSTIKKKIKKIGKTRDPVDKQACKQESTDSVLGGKRLRPVLVGRVSHTGDGSQNTNDSPNPGSLTAQPCRPHRLSLVYPKPVSFKIDGLWSTSPQAASMSVMSSRYVIGRSCD